MIVTLNRDEVKPGEKVKVYIVGAPNSQIFISAIDKSIHHAHVDNTIKDSQVSPSLIFSFI